MDIYTSQAFMNYHTGCYTDCYTDCYTHRFIVEQDYLNACEAEDAAWDALKAMPEYKDFEKAEKALKATPEYKAKEEAWETVKATPEWKAAEKANMKCWRASEAYKEAARRN